MITITPTKGTITMIMDRNMRAASLTLVMLTVFVGSSSGQASTGPIVDGGGATYAVPNPTFETPMDRNFRAVFELRSPAGSPDQLNQNLNTMARYLNMHARAGVPREHVRVAGVVHGGAALEMLQDEHYRAAHGVDNPNRELIAQVLDAGGQLILCGQTAGRLGISQDQLLPGVQVALSAMTALTVLQQDGYQVILW